MQRTWRDGKKSPTGQNHYAAAAVVASLPSLSPGICIGYSAIAIPQIQANDSLWLDSEQISWFTSIFAISAPFGCLISWPLLDLTGRKTTLLLINLPNLVGWLLIATMCQSSSPVPQLYAGRALTGISIGMSSIPTTIYLMEVISPHSPYLRGLIGTWSSIFLSIGVCIVYVLGAIFHWMTIAYIALLFPIVSCCAVAFFLPESPEWLLSKGRLGDSEWAMKKLRLTPTSQPPGLTDIGESCRMIHSPDQSCSTRTEMTIGHTSTCVRPPWKANFLDFLKPETYKPLIILNIFLFFQQFTGVYIVIGYLVNIVEGLHINILDPYNVTMLCGIIQLVTNVVVSLLLPKLGLRLICLSSGTGMAASMLLLALYLLTVEYNGLPVRFNLLPFIAFLFFNFSAAAGFLTLPWLLVGEIFLPSVKCAAGGITTCVAYILCFLALKYFPYFTRDFEEDWANVCFYFSAMSAVATLFLYYLLPETQGRTLEQISENFK
uniref:Major facilitator superfamily (MFS) profile domain-containing protein n=1 Tax=Timema shepardi TaxID=629360 RepID=A0A7R9B4D3_TIMSH|nr:unnamed protein product [Timema shepardi]